MISDMFNRFFDANGDGSAKLTDKAAYELRAIRVSQAVANTKIMAVSNICFTSVISWWFWGRGADLPLAIWMSTLVALSIFAFYKQHTRDDARPISGSKRAYGAITRQAIVISGLFGIAPFFLIPVSVGSDAAIISGIAAGALVVGPYILYSVPQAAIVWLIMATILNTASFSLLGGGAYVVAAIFGIVISIGVGKACLTQAARIRDQFVAQQKLKEKQDVISLLLQEHEDNSSTWVWECNAEGTITRMPPQLTELLYGKGQILKDQISVFDIARRDLNRSQIDAELKLTALLGRARAFHDVIFQVMPADVKHKKDSSLCRWVSVRGKPSFDIAGKLTGFRGIITDITESKLAEDKIRFMAGHDPLTKLANRITFGEGLQIWINDKTPFSTLHLDLDRFKLVNDTMGHLAGDQLLIAVANKLKELSTKAHPDSLVARIGGDEFVVALPLDEPKNGLGVDAKPVEDLAAKIVDALGQPFDLEEGTTTIGASIGFVIYPEDAENAGDMPARADLALYRAKNEGRGRYARYTPEMDKREHDRKRLEAGLRNALQNGELSIVYQPVVDLENGIVSGVEALTRWVHSQFGSIAPDQFIPLAEESGDIVKIGEWVLTSACREAVTWDKPLTIAVNVSAKQILRDDFVPMVLQVLASTKLPPERLELELTESILVQDPSAALEAIKRLRKLGISVVLDDFGTGYSSLSYLREFTFDKIKIDKSFIANLGEEGANETQGAATLVTAIVNLAKTLGMRTTAEGIELESQANDLRAMGCNIGQGYLFARPVPAKDLRKIVGMKPEEIQAIAKIA